MDDTKHKESNAERRAKALRRQIERKHNYRVKVWATNEIAIQGLQAELGEIGAAQVQLFNPDFTDKELLLHLSTMSIEP